ncbi:MAG TPA: ester cyclase [Candidatus Limnocylindrales bacterium]|nr:ester cyclase [Candidatus Limnocylindrales bacterium]
MTTAAARSTEPNETPSDLLSLFGYMRDFEVAYVMDEWSVLEPHFHEDAIHRIDGGALPLGVGGTGREAVIAGLRAGVNAVDRRFDARIPEIVDGPVTRDDGIWMRFELTLRRAGVPDLVVHGEHLARYRDGRIEALSEKVAPGEAARVAAFLVEHDGALRPAGSAFAPPSTGDAALLEAAMGRSLVRCYGGAKSEQDAAAALAVCDPGFSIETIAFGITSRDREDTHAQLEAFFAAFPDYRVTLEGFATGPGVVTCWGRARMTFGGDFLGYRATGRSADAAIFCVFGLAGGTLASERFFFDLAAFCDQIGVPVAELSTSLGLLREADATREATAAA